MRRLIFIILLFITGNSILFGQVTIQARIDSSMLLIGDQTKIRFEVTQDENTKVQFPVLSDSIVQGIDIVEIEKPDTVELDNGQLKINTNIVVTSFDSALYYIPSLKFIAGKDTFESNPLSLKVYTIPVDTAKGIYDIKPVYNAKINWKLVIIIVLISLLSIAILIFLFIYLKKRFFTKQYIEEKRFEPTIPPHVTAIKELDRIKNEKIWQQGRLKEYYTDVTTVLRQYIEHRFMVAALEMTSDEILDSVNLLQIADESVQNTLKQILLLADLVKFAKWVPSSLEHDTTLNNAYLFVDVTKQEKVEEVLEEKPNEDNVDTEIQSE